MADPKKSAAAVGQAPAAVPTDWHFPALEKLFSSEEEAAAVMSNIQKTCKRLDEISRTGSAAEQARAKTALLAYSRALELIHKAREAAEKQAEQVK